MEPTLKLSLITLHRRLSNHQDTNLMVCSTASVGLPTRSQLSALAATHSPLPAELSRVLAWLLFSPTWTEQLEASKNEECGSLGIYTYTTSVEQEYIRKGVQYS